MQKNKTLNLYGMAVTALLIAISIILSRFSVLIPLFGYPSVKFSVAGIPIFLVGSLFGPVFGVCAGFISDIISFILVGGGPYHPGFTINSMLVGLIPGLIFMMVRNKEKTYSFNKFNIVVGLLALAGAIVYINFIGIHDLENIGEIMGMPINIWLTVFMIILVILQIGIVYMLQKHFGGKQQLFSVDKIIFICIIQYVVVNLILTPTWLNQLYGIPVAASVFVRIFKSIIDLPLQVGLIYIVINALPASIRGRNVWKVQ